MILCVDDDTAAQAIAEAARKYPIMNNDDLYQYVREFCKIPVSHRQVVTMMQVVRRERKEAVNSPKGQKGE